MCKYILVTGGLGYIGSHTVVQLIEKGYDVLIVDNLANSKLYVLDNITKITGKAPRFYKYDLMNIEQIESLFKDIYAEGNTISNVIHFAGYKAVGESVHIPLFYYENNINMTINLVKTMLNYKCNSLIFSSSCTVYGSAPLPLTETSQTGIGITNPYGRSKYMIEEMLKDVTIAHPDFSVVLLRYFNPVGCHPSGLIGEDPNGIPTCLFPFILRTAIGIYDKINVFGSDYETRDGTCIRDYIHVMDLAEGHIAALMLDTSKNIHIFNLGTGKGTTVLEMIKAFEEVNGIKLHRELVGRRDGDLPESYANTNKALAELGWKASCTLEDMVKDGWNFITKSS